MKEDDSFIPHIQIEYSVFAVNCLTIPVSVTSSEISFSKLKLIKSYLRSTMSQQRLNELALLSIEKDFLNKINYDNLIDNFASQTTRKINFR